MAAAKRPRLLENASVSDALFTDVQRVLRLQVTALRSTKMLKALLNVEQDQETLMQMLRATVNQGESNSMLIIGRRGSGKSMLMEWAVHKLRAEQPEERFAVLRLSGLVHGDDATALRELARQLAVHGLASERLLSLENDEDGANKDQTKDPDGKEDQQEEEGNAEGAGPADTEKAQSKTREDKEEEEAAQIRLGSLAATVSQMLADLHKGDRSSSQSLIIVLDEFDLFAHAGKQTLLYSLLDLAQAGRTPVAVIGLTCKVDILRQLEKRVLSRFSQRKLHLNNTLQFKDFVLLFCDCLLLQLPVPECEQQQEQQQQKGQKKKIQKKSKGGHETKEKGQETGKEKEASTDKADGEGKHLEEFAAEWNEAVHDLVQQPEVRGVLQNMFDLDRDVRQLHTLALAALSRLTPARCCITPQIIFEIYQSQVADGKVQLLLGASVLEICLLVAMHIAMRRSSNESCNFEMVYDVYRQFAMDPHNRTVDVFGRAVSFKSFEHLIDLELIRPVEHHNKRHDMQYRPMRLLVEEEQMHEVLDKYAQLPTFVKQWAKQSLT